MNDIIQEITEARNIELGLGLQVKEPFTFSCNYVTFLIWPFFSLPPALLFASFKAQVRTPSVLFRENRIRGPEDTDDIAGHIAMAERLLMKHLDAPGKWLQEKHLRSLMNKFCGRYLREKRHHNFIIYSEDVHDRNEHNRRLRNPATTAVQQAIHALA